jgi:hypothetical protein
MSRDSIRKAVLNSKPKSKVVKVFGQDVEIRQATVGELLKESGPNDTQISRADAFAHLLIRFCFVPGTNERVFEEADIESLKDIPLGEELTAMQNAVNDLMGLDVKGELKNSGKIPSDTT